MTNIIIIVFLIVILYLWLFLNRKALPALGLLTIKDDNEPDITSHLNLKTGKLKPSGYGLVTVLRSHRRPKYPIAIVFVLMTKLFEAFAANGIRSKYNVE